MSAEIVLYVWFGGVALGAVLGHRFLPPRIDEEREAMLSRLLAEKAHADLLKKGRF